MITTTDGTPVAEALVNARLRALEVASRRRGPAYQMRPAPDGGMERHYRVLRDKLGDVYRVYRQLWVDRPGAGYLAHQRAKQAAQ